MWAQIFCFLIINCVFFQFSSKNEKVSVARFGNLKMLSKRGISIFKLRIYFECNFHQLTTFPKIHKTHKINEISRGLWFHNIINSNSLNVLKFPRTLQHSFEHNEICKMWNLKLKTKVKQTHKQIEIKCNLSQHWWQVGKRYLWHFLWIYRRRSVCLKLSKIYLGRLWMFLKRLEVFFELILTFLTWSFGSDKFQAVELIWFVDLSSTAILEHYNILIEQTYSLKKLNWIE